MRISVELLRRKDRKAPGVFSAVAAIAKAAPGGQALEVCDADYRRLLADFGLSRGLGDTVAKVAAAVGFTPCGGCAKRRQTLNERFPY